MKRSLVVALAAVLLSAGTAMAGVQGSPHDMITAWGAAPAQGVCSYCHVPHSAQGARLWPSIPNAAITGVFGTVGGLCYSCHGAVVIGTATSNNVTNTVFNQAAGINNHLLTNTSNYPDTSTAAVNGLTPPWPWTNAVAGNMECTSCHNVHVQTSASGVAGPGAINFLREPYYLGTAAVPTGMFCTACHTNRMAVASKNALGTHPVGGTVVDGRSGTAGTVPMTAIYLATGGTQLVPHGQEEGGHTVVGDGTGGVACWTCHQPHGASEKLLFDPPFASGTLRSTVCESCHQTTPSLSDAANTKLIHPVDAGTGDDSVLRGGVATPLLINRPWAAELGNSTATYQNWLNATSGGVGGEVVCLSCHGAHGADPGTQIFRAQKSTPGDGICNNCHGTVFAGRASHPVGVGVTMANEHGANWPNKGLLPLQGGNMTCETCHAGHNGEVGARFILRRKDTNSEICVDCHTPTDTITTQPAPFPVTNAAADISNSANPSLYIRERLYDASYVGAVGSRLGTHAAYRTIRATGNHNLWKPTLTGSTISNFYGTAANTIICQSCHTPHDASPTGGVGGTAGSKNLLWKNNGVGIARVGVDGGNTGNDQQDGYAEATDSYCQACHVPTGTHAVQAWTVSRTNAPVGIAAAVTNTFIRATPLSPADYATGPGMTCESCHSPHAAATATGSWILEAGTSVVNAGGTGGERPDDRNRDALCNLCHNY